MRLGAKFPVAQQGGDSTDAEPPRYDAQFRGEVEITAPLYRNLRLVLGGDLRLARHVPDDCFARAEIGLRYDHRLTQRLRLTARYRLRATDEFDGGGERERRFSLDAAARFPLGRLAITDNNVLERRLLPDGNETRYRNRLRIGHPLGTGNGASEVFVSDEVYYSWRDEAWTRNRFTLGVDRSLGAGVAVEVYYLRQADWRGRPERPDVIGVDLEIDVR